VVIVHLVLGITPKSFDPVNMIMIVFVDHGLAVIHSQVLAILLEGVIALEGICAKDTTF